MKDITSVDSLEKENPSSFPNHDGMKGMEGNQITKSFFRPFLSCSLSTEAHLIFTSHFVKLLTNLLMNHRLNHLKGICDPRKKFIYLKWLSD